MCVCVCVCECDDALIFLEVMTPTHAVKATETGVGDRCFVKSVCVCVRPHTLTCILLCFVSMHALLVYQDMFAYMHVCLCRCVVCRCNSVGTAQ